MEDGEREWGVEVVVEGGRELIPRRGARRPVDDAEGGSKVLGLPTRRLHRLVRVLDRAAVVGAQEEDENRLAAVGVERIPQRDDVPDRLRHLLLRELEQAVVSPEAGELTAGAARLGELVLVMRETEVDAPAVDLEDRAEKLLGHRRALDVPARPPEAPGRGPGGVLVRLRRLPEGEVALVVLQVAGLLGDHVLDPGTRELPVVRVARDAEVDVALRLVG